MNCSSAFPAVHRNSWLVGDVGWQRQVFHFSGNRVYQDLAWGNEQGNGFRTLGSTHRLTCENTP
jgi:hypothetical protein